MFFFLKYDLNDSARVSWSLESFFMLLSFEFDGGLPGYDLIEEILLFNAAFVKIDAGGLDTFVTQNIGEKCNIIASFHKIFCEQMAEGMWVNNGWIKMIAQSENFQLITDPVSTDRTAKAVQEQTAFGPVFVLQPHQTGLPYTVGEINMSDLVAF